MGNSPENYFEEIARRKRELYGKKDIISTAEVKGKLLGINGSMDYIERVVPHCYCAQKVVVEPSSRPPDLSQYHVILVGCPGNLDSAWIDPLKKYVNAGGYLVTTDWSLSNLIPKVAPGYIIANGKGQGMYKIRLVDRQHPFLANADSASIGEWEIETSSDLMQVKNKRAVKVLIDSEELQKETKKGAIMVTFPQEKGHIVHFISHLHLQKSSSDDNYTAAFILTNIIDEAIRVRYGLKAPKVKIKRILSKTTQLSGKELKRDITVRIKKVISPGSINE